MGALWLPQSTVTCVLVSSSHMCVRGSPLCKCHAPHPRDLGTNPRVFLVSTPQDHVLTAPAPLPALPLGGMGGEGASHSVTRMYSLWIFFFFHTACGFLMGFFSLRSCTLGNIKQFVIEAGGLLLACLPGLGPLPLVPLVATPSSG